MNDRELSEPRRRRMPFSRPRRLPSRRGEIRDPERFEVQKRDESGLIASVVFYHERQALTFADALSRLMARTGEIGSVQVVWPHPLT